MTTRVLVLGAGGHGRAVAALLADLPEWALAGFVDAAPASALRWGMPVLGDEAALPALRAAGIAAAIVAIGDNPARLAAAARLEALGFLLPAVLHPSVIRAADAQVAPGVVAMPRVVIGAAARIGRLAILNTGAIVEHDVVVGEAAHVAIGALLSGEVRVGAGALIGAGAVCRPGVTIGAGATVGLGAAVVGDVAPGARVGGVPARALG